MTSELIERINFLARKAKGEGLTETEKTEQQQLREEYRSAFRRNLEAQLDHTYIMDEKGHKRKLKK